MQKSNVIIQAIFGIAIAVLFVLHFQDGTSSTDVTDSEEGNATAKVADSLHNVASQAMVIPVSEASTFPIAYINIDTFNLEYKYLADMRNKLEQEVEREKNQLMSERKALEEEYQKFMTQVQQGMFSQQEAQQMDMRYQERNQEQMAKIQESENRLVQNQIQIMNSLRRELDSYISDYNKDLKFSYILAYSYSNSPILWANDSLDITSEILTGMNAAYSKKIADLKAKKK